MLAKATLHTIEVVEQIQPRIIRLKNAPQYLGMNRNLFNKEVRPGLVTVPIGQQGIGFDRLDLDAWVDAYKQCNGRPRDISGVEPWVKETRQDSANAGTSGTSRKQSKGYDFSKALAKVTGKKAETYPLKRVEEIRQVEVYGQREKRNFSQAAARYLHEHEDKRSILRDAESLKVKVKSGVWHQESAG